MLRYQIGTIVRRPVVRLKMGLLSFLFILMIVEQLSILPGFAAAYGGEGQLSVAVFLTHAFNYYDLFLRIFMFGYLLLIPDIVEDLHLERHMVMLNGTRRRAARAALLRISVMTVLYVLWFVLLAMIVSGIYLRNFSLEWPAFLANMHRVMGGDGRTMGLIMIPESASGYPLLVALLLVLLRNTLGFLFLGFLAGIVTLVTGKSLYGVVVDALLTVWAVFCYLEGSCYLGIFNYYSIIAGARIHVNLGKYTILPMFTFEALSDDFTQWVGGGIAAGAVLSLVTAAAIMCYYKKGDLGDANRDE